MDSRPVLFVDSGLGSLSYAFFFRERNPDETVFCLADRECFPYGEKSRDFLAGRLVSLFRRLLRCLNPKLAALACNTASVSALDALRESFPALPIVGTVPAVKPAVLASRTGLAGVLGSERTIADPYINHLAEKYGSGCRIMGEAAQSLVHFVEKEFIDADEDAKMRAVRPWVEKFRAAGADGIVLACTHFLLLKEEFRRAAGEGITIYDSVDGISRRLEYFLDQNGGSLRASAGKGHAEGGKIRLLLTGTGAVERSWYKNAEYFGFEPGLLSDMEANPAGEGGF